MSDDRDMSEEEEAIMTVYINASRMTAETTFYLGLSILREEAETGAECLAHLEGLVSDLRKDFLDAFGEEGKETLAKKEEELAEQVEEARKGLDILVALAEREAPDDASLN